MEQNHPKTVHTHVHTYIHTYIHICTHARAYTHFILMYFLYIYIYIYFKSTVTSKTETETPRKKNKSKIQAMVMEFLRSIEGKTRRDRIRSDIFWAVVIQNQLIELEKKQRFGHLKRMDSIMITRISLNWKLKKNRPMKWPRTNSAARY
jgi:hypothetical protein